MLVLNRADIDAWSRFLRQELGNRKAWQNLMRYQIGSENKLFKTIHESQRLRMARRGATVPAPLVAVDLDISRDG